MKDFKQKAFIILTGLSPILPFIYLFCCLANNTYSALHFVLVGLSVIFAFISVGLTHSNRLYLSWEEFIIGRYEIKRLSSDPLAMKIYDKNTFRNISVLHCLVSTFFFIDALFSLVDENYMMAVVFFIYFAYCTIIGILFYNRSIKAKRIIKINLAGELKWRKAKKEYLNLLSTMTQTGKNSCYSRKNLRKTEPNEIKRLVIYDLMSMEYWSLLTTKEKSILVDDAYSKIMLRRENFKIV